MDLSSCAVGIVDGQGSGYKADFRTVGGEPLRVPAGALPAPNLGAPPGVPALLQNVCGPWGLSASRAELPWLGAGLSLFAVPLRKVAAGSHREHTPFTARSVARYGWCVPSLMGCLRRLVQLPRPRYVRRLW
ncbi:hypothetical protein GCM10011583_24610 [Streptomyces camponoticapitis]|uniref:Uncharacterized protein n=1 Tax=Streptomyces camponoticapitis TaxID=1616125 RepID=A0ABQ2E3K1_9ACTN|nr:hypothetical protein GCM10011583_24610 [Streptomyces camponoticapitis]